MKKFCVFAGTYEGRRLVEFLCARGAAVTACVATEYGQTLLPEAENLTVSARPLPEAEIRALLRRERFELVIDATHPYAAAVTDNIMSSCEKTGTEYLRLQRGGEAVPKDAVCFDDIPSAVSYLNGTAGNILLTTGSKELSA